MEEPRAGELEGAEQGAERAVMVAFDFEPSAAVRVGRTRVQNRVHLALQQVFLDGVKELFGFLKRQAQMFNASVVLLQGDEIGDGFCMAIITVYDELKFHVHGGASPGSSGG
jgi:hypothetical protein